MKNHSKYYNPVEVIQTNNWHSKLKDIMRLLSLQNPLIITSRGNLKRNALDLKFKTSPIFSEIYTDPTFTSCQTAINFADAYTPFDSVFAIGGGSVMDTAKVIIASEATGIKDINHLIKAKGSYYKKALPSIFIPTTHGTGSEVTMWGTVWNTEERKKYSIADLQLYPTVAILDPNLTLSLPLDLSIITALDALSHSFESIWNKNANAISTSTAIESIELIIRNINRLKNDKSNLLYRNKLLLASNKAGLAFSNTKTAAAHSISYPLSIKYNIPHGIAASITLPSLIEINYPHIEKELKNIEKKLGLSIEKIKEFIISIPEGVFDFSLNKWGINKKDIPNLVKDSFYKGRMDNNIVTLTEPDVHSILINCF